MGVLIPDPRGSQHLPIWSASACRTSLVHYDDNTNFWLVFWLHAFTSTKPCSTIKIMCRYKYDKANTNTCYVMWLVKVVLFKDCPASLIVFFTLPLKKKAMFSTKALSTDPFSSTYMNCWLWFYYWFRRGFYPKSTQTRKNSCIAYGICIKDITCGTCTEA